MSAPANPPTPPPLNADQIQALALVKDLSPHLAEAVRGLYASLLHGDQQAQPENELPEDAWRAYTLADAYQERPPVEYITGKLFELPSLNIVYGAPGTLKSFLLQDLSICVAAGQPWLAPAPWNDPGGSGMKTKRAPRHVG